MSTPVLELSFLSKTFSGTRALDDVSLTIEPGQIHALMGENGSGKSTLIKILSGFHHPDDGARMAVRGTPVDLPMKVSDPYTLGLGFVHQDLGLIEEASVVENLFIKRFETRAGWIAWRRESRRAAALLERYGLADVHPGASVASLGAPQRAMLAIARAVSCLDEMPERDGGGRSGVLVVDETTSFLPPDGVERVLNVLRKVAAQGHGVLFVSHQLDEIYSLCDCVTLLRDGRVVTSAAISDLGRDELVEKMLTPGLAHLSHEAAATTDKAHGGAVLLSVTDLRCGAMGPLSFSLGTGEVVGITGLLGAGFELVPYAMFGAVRASGRLDLKSRTVKLSSLSPSQALRLGLGLVPGDRLAQGCLAEGTVAENSTVLLAGTMARHGFLSPRAESREAMAMIEDFDVRPRQAHTKLKYLSGGNQQKVIMAKWSRRNPTVLLLHEPTRGVDIGAKRQILARITAMAADGTGVVLASSDLGDLARVCDRVLVLRRGELAAAVEGEITEDGIRSAIHGRPSHGRGPGLRRPTTEATEAR